jgi:hypothetical protein
VTSIASGHRRAVPGPAVPAQDGAPRPYVQVPDKLLRTCPHDPLAVGIYLTVARCAIAERGPAPISAADLVAWEGGAHSRPAVLRRIRSLLAAGWLTAERGGMTKLRLLPTWGRGADLVAQLWQLGQPHLARPASVRVRRVPIELLDTYLGRMDLQPGRRAAVITRYFDRPLLDLADLGSYALLHMTAEPTRARLEKLGLAVMGVPQLPNTLPDLVAAAGTGELHIDSGGAMIQVGLSPFGQRWLRRIPASSESLSESPSESLSESPSESRDNEIPEPRLAALLCTPVASATQCPPRTWEPMDQRIEGILTAPPAERRPERGGGRHQPRASAHRSNAQNPDTVELLRAKGVRRPEALGGVSTGLITSWCTALQHPALAARFADPVAFAVSQMRRGQERPAEDELARWLEHARRRDDPHGTRRHFAPVDPPDVAERCRPALAYVSEGPAAGAYARETERPPVGSTIAADGDNLAAQDLIYDEEVYRALIARTARR